MEWHYTLYVTFGEKRIMIEKSTNEEVVVAREQKILKEGYRPEVHPSENYMLREYYPPQSITLSQIDCRKK